MQAPQQKPTHEIPAISIIMPVRNAEPWLKACLRSIIAQSFERWELIAVDDHSADESLELLQHWAARDSRIKALRSLDKGILPALQMALEASSGNVITRMDADDVMPLSKLDNMLKALGKYPSSIVTGQVKYFSEGGHVAEGYQRYEVWLNQRITQQDHERWKYRECTVAGANWMCHRTSLPQNLLKLSYPEDYDLVLWWHRHGMRFHSLQEVTHEWREHPQRTSRTSENYQQQAFFSLKINRFLADERDHHRPLVILGKNQKSKLTIQVLNQAKEEFLQLDEQQLPRLLEVENPQVLVAVFPKEKHRKAISDLLLDQELEMGRDWWWL